MEMVVKFSTGDGRMAPLNAERFIIYMNFLLKRSKCGMWTIDSELPESHLSKSNSQ